MAISTKISELTPDEVSEVESTLVEMLLDVYPNLDLGRGRVLQDILVRPSAILQSLNNANISKLQRSMSLAEVNADPTLADTDTVDNILSNFLLTRQTASKTTGLTTIVLSSSVTTTIVSGTVFTDGLGNRFLTTASYTAVTVAAAVISVTDRLLRVRSDGRYYFTVPVQAETAGYRAVRKDTRFTLNPSPVLLHDAYAEADFTPGRAEESNAELTGRLAAGVTAKVMSGRSNIAALLTTHFPSIVDVSCVGFGDEEMNRDRHNIFNISQGGKADLYVRTAKLPLSKTIEVSALLRSIAAQTWEFALSRDVAPGFYRVISILPTATVGAVTGSLEIVLESRSLGLSDDGSGFTPSIYESHEGVYTRYQTTTITFKDTITPLAGLVEGTTKKSYTVTVSIMPDIELIQSFVNARDRRHPQADYLVRAAIPCYVSAEVAVGVLPGTTVDVPALQNAAANAVNALTFKFGRLPTSIIVDALQELLPVNAAVHLPVLVWGTLRKPDGAIVYLNSTTTLYVPKSVMTSVSNRTTSFFMDPADVSITVTGLDLNEA